VGRKVADGLEGWKMWLKEIFEQTTKWWRWEDISFQGNGSRNTPHWQEETFVRFTGERQSTRLEDCMIH
jgi:hypothetical protein